jgi:FAD binding domain
MKLLLVLLAVARLSHSLPHGPDEDEPGMGHSGNKNPSPKPSPSPSPSPAVSPPATINKPNTPAGCRVLNTDAEFPAESVWKAELPSAISRKTTLAEYVKAPDYKVAAMKYSDVVDAVKFAAKHNLRLSVIASGHDFIGRNDAPSGIVIDVSGLTGITVHESFTPTVKGADKPGKANVIKPQPGKDAAVTIGAGVTTQVLNNALHNSKLVSVGAAHGSVTVTGGYVCVLSKNFNSELTICSGPNIRSQSNLRFVRLRC